MIFVILGTHELPFTRLIHQVEQLKLQGIVDDEVIVQSGHTKYKSNVLTLKPFVSYEEMEELYNKARIIITHAGTGSVITGLRKGKKVIASPRLKKYGEHNDDHQIELVKVFREEGHILSWQEDETLEKVIEKVKHFKPRPFKSEKQKMINLLKDFIDNI